MTTQRKSELATWIWRLVLGGAIGVMFSLIVPTYNMMLDLYVSNRNQKIINEFLIKSDEELKLQDKKFEAEVSKIKENLVQIQTKVNISPTFVTAGNSDNSP